MRSSLLFRRWRRVLLTLIPLALALLHVSAAMPLPLLERLDQFIYDARLRLGMSRTLDERIVIVDICRIPDDHMVACETDAGVSDTTLSSPASAYCS